MYNAHFFPPKKAPKIEMRIIQPSVGIFLVQMAAIDAELMAKPNPKTVCQWDDLLGLATS